MKTTLENIPEHKQTELKGIVSALIPRYSDIEMIILFGSYARGEAVEDKYEEEGTTYEYKSDYDLLIILSSNGKAENESLTSSITGTIDSLKYPTPANPIFHGVDFVNKQLADGNYFFGDIKKEGILLFTTNRYQLAPKCILSPEEMKAKAERDFTNYFNEASIFFKTFQYNYKDHDYKIAAFQLHQATERYYNTVELVFTRYKSKTHDIKILGKLVQAFDMEFGKIFPQVTPQEKHRFALLKKAYVDARYDVEYKITKEDLDYLSDRVERLRQLTQKICIQKINSFVGMKQ